MSKSDNNLVIMAGGVGSRFWPMSTPECPKQFIDVFGTGRTFLQMTFDRFKGVVEPDNVWVVTSEKYHQYRYTDIQMKFKNSTRTCVRMYANNS